MASETHKTVQMFHLAGRKIFTIPLQKDSCHLFLIFLSEKFANSHYTIHPKTKPV